MVDALASKTVAWETERGVEFTYDGVSILPFHLLKKLTVLNLSCFHAIFESLKLLILQIRLLSMLEEYTILRQEKEEERRRQRV